MAILDILTYPHPLLKKPCVALSEGEICSPDIQQLIADMTETMYANTGAVGLAAAQVGRSVRMVVMDATAKTTRDRLFVLINPDITAQSQWKFSREGCLSFPDYLVTVKRARKITLNWLDPQGNRQEDQFRDFEAIIAQHETDHLDGILFLDRIKNIQTDLIYRLPSS